MESSICIPCLKISTYRLPKNYICQSYSIWRIFETQCIISLASPNDVDQRRFLAGSQSRLIMVALCNRADHYIFILFLLLLFPRLISAVGDWMSAILSHMVWP